MTGDIEHGEDRGGTVDRTGDREVLERERRGGEQPEQARQADARDKCSDARSAVLQARCLPVQRRQTCDDQSDQCGADRRQHRHATHGCGHHATHGV